jgi:hypothetical protein
MFTRLALFRLSLLIAAGPLLSGLPVWAAPPTDSSSPATPPAPARPLEQLHQALALTPQQQVFWQAYLDRLDAYTQLHYRTRPAPAAGTETAVRQFARVIDQLQSRLAALEDIEHAVGKLYAALTPEQRKLADQQLYTTLPVFASAGAITLSTLPPSETRKGDGPPEGRPPRGRPGGF